MARATTGTRPRTIAFHKPFDVLPSFTDLEGRPTLADYIDVPGVYAAGRLDRDSEGLMILTSDGALAHRITDPAHKLPKVYLVQVERVPDEDAVARLRTGVLLRDTRTKPAGVSLLSGDPPLPARAVPIRFRKNVPDRVAGDDAARRDEPPGAPHDRGRRAPHAAPRARRHRSGAPGRFAAWGMA